jgi:hypothetical protein
VVAAVMTNATVDSLGIRLRRAHEGAGSTRSITTPMNAVSFWMNGSEK